LDTFSDNTGENAFYNIEVDRNVIGIRDATFSWSSESDGSLTPSSRPFRLRIDSELIFRAGHINLIVGPTGSGKTSLLMALLGQQVDSMHLFVVLNIEHRRIAFHTL